MGADILKLTGPIEMPAYNKTITADNFLLEIQKAVEIEYDRVENKPKKLISDLIPEVTFHIFGIPKSFHQIWFDPIDGEMHNYRQSSQPNIIYHGQVPSEQLDKMIRGYHAGLRTCEFDGCPHTVTKGVLLGQWPINCIPYPHTDSYKTKEELIKLLKGLKNKKKPNLAGHRHWLATVSAFPWQ